MSNLDLNEIMGLIDGATTVSPSSSQPSTALSLNDISNLIPDLPKQQAPAPSAPTAYDELSVLQTKSTGLNSAVRGVLQLGSNLASTFGDFETSKNLDLTVQQYFAPEAPNFQTDTGTFAYESLASNAPQMGLTIGLAAIPVVGIPLAIASVALPQFGESRKAIYEATGEDNAYAALVPASINTALDLAVPMRIAKKLGLTSVLKSKFDEVGKNTAGYIAKETAVTAGAEGLTEAAQWATNLATTRFLTDKSVLERLTPTEQQDALNNFFGGVFGGGGFGLGAAAYTSYKKGETKKAIEKELADLDDLLNNLKVDPNAPATPTATQSTDPTQTPSTQSEAAIPPPATRSSILDSVTVSKDEALPDLKVEVANTIKALPKDTYDMTLSALEARRQELTSLLSAIDTDINLKALSVPSAYENLDGIGSVNATANSSGLIPFFNSFGGKMSGFYASKSNQGSTVFVDSMMVKQTNGKLLSPVSVVVKDPQSKSLPELQTLGELTLSTLQSLGLDKTPEGSPIKVVMVDTSFRKNNKESLGGMFSNKDHLVIDINIPIHGNKRAVYETLYHELGHYIAIKLAADAMLAKSPEIDALRAAYAQFSSKGLSVDQQKKGTPLHASFAKEPLTAEQARTEYHTDFGEWLAEGFRQAMQNRIADGSLDVKSTAPSVYDNLNKALRRLYRMSKKYFGSNEAGIETFQQFVDRSLARRELLEVEAKIAEMTANKAKDIIKEDELLKESPKKPSKDLLPDHFKLELVSAMQMIQAFRSYTGQEATWAEAANYIGYMRKNVFDDESVTAAYESLSPEFISATARFNEKKKHRKESNNPVVETLRKLRLNSQAANTNQLMEVNMGILGDSVLGRFFRSIMTPLQVAEQAQNRGFSLGKVYMGIVQQLQLMKTTVVEMADTTLKTWRQGGAESTTRVSKALYVISTKSDELNRRLTPDELEQVFDGLNMTPEERAAWADVDKSFTKVLEQMWSSTILDIARTYNPDPRNRQAAKDFRDAYLAAASQTDRNTLVETYTGQPLIDADLNLNPMMQAIDNYQAAHSKMQNKNYFPRSRLGEYVVRIKANAKGDEWEGHIAKNAGETLGFYAFDTEAEQKAFMEAIADDVSGMKVLGHKLDSEVFSVMGLPAGIIDQIVRDMDANPATKLTALQRELLNDIALQRSPGKRFLRHMTRRRGIAGYSEDALRVYANYMSMASNHLARSEYSPELASVISNMQNEIQNPSADLALVNDLNVMKDYFVRHFDYLMKPDNDWATLRSIGFLWYLGFNVKSALVNLMQTPMVTLPVLSKDIGTAKAAGRIATSMKDIVTHLTKRSTLSADELSMIDYMLKANLIDESLVSELAGLGEADALKRLIPGMNAQSILTKVSWYGGAMFRMGEKFNRYSTALASYRIARQDLRLSHEDALQYSVDAIQASQFEYAKFNRPEFMRGKKSVIFLFWQYIQHASYLFFGGKGSRVAKRMWLLALAIAGIEGLPFAQLLMKLIDFGGTTVQEIFGVTDPKVETNKMIRELILNIYDRPDDIMKGMSYQWGLGPFHLLSPLGVPVPNVTTEGSLGFGNPVPWFDGLLDPTVKDMDKALGQTAAAMLGPIGGMVLGVVEALGYSKEEDNWKRWEKTLPVFMKNASQGTRWMVQGEETTSNGMQVVQFETPEQRAEVALKTLGFTPTRSDQTRRQMRAAQESLLYYQARKQMLMDTFWYAKQTGDREALADARQAIRDYNASVREAKLGQFMIKSDSLRTSVSERAKARALSERGIAPDKRQEALRRQAERLIPVTAKGNEE